MLTSENSHERLKNGTYMHCTKSFIDSSQYLPVKSQLENWDLQKLPKQGGGLVNYGAGSLIKEQNEIYHAFFAMNEKSLENLINQFIGDKKEISIAISSIELLHNGISF